MVHYLRKVRSYPYEGEVRFLKLFIDLKRCEFVCNTQLLPQYASQSDSIALFSRTETLTEITMTRYNQRQQDALIEWLKRNPDQTPPN